MKVRKPGNILLRCILSVAVKQVGEDYNKKKKEEESKKI